MSLASDDSPNAVATRLRLEKAATEAFGLRGYHATTTRDIAAAAGMGAAAVYMHHRSKEELLYRISRAGHEAVFDLVRTTVDSSAEPSAALRTLVSSFVLRHARNRTSARVVNYELRALSSEHYDEILQLRRATEAALRRLIERGRDTGEFDTPDPQLATTALLSLGIDVARWYRAGGRWTPEDLAAQYADFALRIVGAHQSLDQASTSQARKTRPST